jgi:hypothetical protein
VDGRTSGWISEKQGGKGQTALIWFRAGTSSRYLFLTIIFTAGFEDKIFHFKKFDYDI